MQQDTTSHFERFDSKKASYERTDEEIAETNETYNQHLNGLFGVPEVRASDADVEDISFAVSIEAREALGSDSSLTGSGSEGFSEGVAEVHDVLSQAGSAESANLSHSIDTAASEVYSVLDEAGVDEVDRVDIEERVVAAKLESAARGEEVVGKAEFLSQERQDEAALAAVAEQVVNDAERGDTDTVAYVEKLTAESEEMRSFIHTAKEAGGVNRLDNKTLAEAGKIIRNYDLSVEAAAEQVQQEADDDQTEALAESSEYMNDISLELEGKAGVSEETQPVVDGEIGANQDEQSHGQQVSGGVSELLRKKQELGGMTNEAIKEALQSRGHTDTTQEDYDLVA